MNHNEIEFMDVDVTAATVQISICEIFEALSSELGGTLCSEIVGYYGNEILGEFVRMAEELNTLELNDIITIKPCPHCGAVHGVVHIECDGDLLDNEDPAQKRYRVVCDINRHCDASVPSRQGCGSSSRWAHSSLKAILLWNTRTNAQCTQ